MNERDENLNFLNNYINENINIQNMNNLINNSPHLESAFNIIFNFISITFCLSILQWLFKTLYFYFCYDPSFRGIFTNMITIFNPFCYYLNLLQWKISDSIIIITISIFMNSSRGIFRYFRQQTQGNN